MGVRECEKYVENVKKRLRSVTVLSPTMLKGEEQK